MNKLILALGAAFVISSCTWVKPTNEREKVRVLEAHEVAGCKSLGATTVSLVDKLVGVKRSPQKVAGELRVLARNSAAELGGDTVVAASGVSDGKQTYKVYRCVGVNASAR